jgi:glycosyltransferase involved in cell wall biosynthesis
MAKLDKPGVQLFVAGDDPDRNRYHRLAADLGLSNRIVFGGFRRDISTALASADIFLFPSWYEAFSLATIEAAACSLPVVATSINGTEDFIQPGVNGEFVESDPNHIAKVLEPLVQDAGKRQEMGRNARKLVEENYTWDRVTEQTEDAYKEYLASKTSQTS